MVQLPDDRHINPVQVVLILTGSNLLKVKAGCLMVANANNR